MKIFSMADIHGCIDEFEIALSIILEDISNGKAKLVLLGDYVHGGCGNAKVLDRIIDLQNRFGTDRIIALLGNHDEMVLNGEATIHNDSVYAHAEECEDGSDNDKYIGWLSALPRYYVEGNTIFVHAGIDEEAGDMWELGTAEEIFTSKYLAETGKIEGINMKVVAGHIGTAVISGDKSFHDIYFDGESHYYIDGTVLESGVIPVLMVDTKDDKYYQVSASGKRLIEPYKYGLNQ